MTYESPWTDERVARLQELWPDPTWTCAAIASELGGGINKNAAVGRAHRMELGPKPSNHPKAVSMRNPRPKPRRQKPPRNFGGVWGTYPEKVEPFVPRPSDVVILGLTILEIKDRQCKYIPGDDGLCCGHAAAPDKPYCASHYDITHGVKIARSPAQKAADAKLVQRTSRRTPDAQAWIAEEVA